MKTLLPTVCMWLTKDPLHPKVERKASLKMDTHWPWHYRTETWPGQMSELANSQLEVTEKQSNFSMCFLAETSVRRGSCISRWRTHVRSCPLSCQSKWPTSIFPCVLDSKWVTSLKAKSEWCLFPQLPLGLGISLWFRTRRHWASSQVLRMGGTVHLWFASPVPAMLDLRASSSLSNTTCELASTANLFPGAVRIDQSFPRAHSYRYTKSVFQIFWNLPKTCLYKAWMFHVNIRYSCILSEE